MGKMLQMDKKRGRQNMKHHLFSRRQMTNTKTLRETLQHLLDTLIPSEQDKVGKFNKGKMDLQLLYTDTDSLFYSVETKDFYDDLAANPNLMLFMDTSNLPPDHKCYSTVRKRIPGLFKNVTDSRTVYEFVALRAKSYAYDVEQDVCIRTKGVMGQVIRNHLTFAEHKRCLFADADDDAESDECDDEFDATRGKMIKERLNSCYAVDSAVDDHAPIPRLQLYAFHAV
ncbi:PREDICTED: uncharacterized protein LOC107166697 [Diuraphis noxia]|uniref:uncharacterized protein LOC107166697 n=1 Tax=Diuraphis noxia TaxID=143948 RepID=UPI000763877F|nr:PREDICTED: uncharacterized protein LOC107166697 [Diuraphis noxia]